jgi:hypothetical protein
VAGRLALTPGTTSDEDRALTLLDALQTGEMTTFPKLAVSIAASAVKRASALPRVVRHSFGA